MQFDCLLSWLFVSHTSVCLLNDQKTGTENEVELLKHMIS